MKTLQSLTTGRNPGAWPSFLEGMRSSFDLTGTGHFISQERHPLREETMYSGPIPDPEQLQAYENVHPGLAARIFQMAKDEQEHRFLIERRKTCAIARGQYTALLVVILLIAAGVTCALCGHQVVAGTIFTTTIIGSASVFLLGRKHEEKTEKTDGQT